jgi:hypothetical protein
VLEPKAALLGRYVADFLVDLLPVGHLAYPYVAVIRAATTPGSHCRVAGMSANTAQTSSGVALMSMVLLIVGMSHSLSVGGWSSNRCDGSLVADSSSVAA